MNVLMFAAEYVGNDSGILVGSLLMSLLCIAGVAVIAVASVLYVKRGVKEAAKAAAEKADDKEEVNESAVEETVEPVVEETAEPVVEEPAPEPVVEETVEPVVEETAEPVVEEPAPEPVVEETAEPVAEVAATVAVAEEEETEEEAGIPAFIDDIMSELGDASKELFSYRVIGRNYGAMNTMKDVRDYATEKEFLDDFFKNANRFYKPFNAEIFTVLYERQKQNKRGNELSKLNVRYANALYYYRKDDPTLVGKTIMILKDDVDYQLGKDSTYLTKVPSLKKLILIYSSRGDYDEAIEYCDKAVERKIYDVRQSGFEPRRKALIEKRERAEARKARAAKKLAAKE